MINEGVGGEVLGGEWWAWVATETPDPAQKHCRNIVPTLLGGDRKCDIFCAAKTLLTGEELHVFVCRTFQSHFLSPLFGVAGTCDDFFLRTFSVALSAAAFGDRNGDWFLSLSICVAISAALFGVSVSTSGEVRGEGTRWLGGLRINVEFC